MSAFDVSSTPRPDGTEMRITVSGTFDELIAPTLQRTVDRMRLGPGDRVVLDLREVDSADVAGVRLVLRLHARCLAARCRLRIRPAPPAVQELFASARARPSSLEQGRCARLPAENRRRADG